MKKYKKEKTPNCKCSFCGKEIYKPNYLIKGRKYLFCNRECQSKGYKTILKGENNPNYGNKWNKKQKEHLSKVIKQKYIDDPEYREKVAVNKGKKLPGTSKGLKEFYKTHDNHFKGKKHSDKTKKIIGKKSKEKFTQEFKNMVRKTMERNGFWIPLDEKEDCEIYYEESNWKKGMFNTIEDDKQLEKLNKFGVFNSFTNTEGIVRDHMYSRKSGFENKVFPEILRHPCNCQLLTSPENASKRSNNSITLEQLFEKIYNYKENWFEQNLVLIKIEEYKSGKRWKNPYKTKNEEGKINENFN